MRRLVITAAIIGSGVFFSMGAGEPVIFAVAVILAFIQYRGIK